MDFIKTLLTAENGTIISIGLFWFGLILYLSPRIWKRDTLMFRAARQAMSEEAQALGQMELLASLQDREEKVQKNSLKMLCYGKILMVVGIVIFSIVTILHYI